MHREEKKKKKALAKVSWANLLKKNAKQFANSALAAKPQKNLES